MNKVKKQCTRYLSLLLVVCTIFTVFTLPVSAGVPGTGVEFTVKSLKVTSSPIEEENDITVEAVYHASVSNYGWDSTVWKQCDGCGGAGMNHRYGGLGGGSGGVVDEVELTCGQSFEGRTWMCRAGCDGNDYFNQFDMEGDVTHNTENPWDGDSTNNWDDGNQHIWDKQNPIPCECSMKVAIGNDDANSGMIACMGCGGLGSIYKGTVSCSGCIGSGCHTCGGSGSIKIFEPCGECGGGGQVSEYIPCTSCGGSGGHYVTVHHDPIEPVSKISTMVDIRIDGEILEIQEITFDLTTTAHDSNIWTKEGDVTVTWTINTGEGIGEKDVETDINDGEDKKIIPIEVVPACNLKIKFVPPNANYRAGTEVISTFVVENYDATLGLNIRPKHKLTADFTAKSGNKVLATKQVKDVVIPKGKSNIIYFKWLVPEDTPIGNISVECKINTGYIINNYGVNEKDLSDNTATATHKVDSYLLVETPDTQFEEKAPNWFRVPNSSDNVKFDTFAKSVINSSSFEQWEWANDWYKLASYSVKLDATNKVVPDINSPSHKLVDDIYQIRSGYGISTDVKSKITSNAPVTAITDVQSATMHLPEYRYSSDNDKFRTLELTAPNVFNFAQNENAKDDKGTSNNRRIHFTPLYYPDGDYNVKSYVFDLWTPNGMLSFIASDEFTIIGDMYDDWYISQTKPH